MTPAQIELARHALGLNERRRMSYRNVFVVGLGHGDYAEWMKMVEAGDAIFSSGASWFGGDDLFRLTMEGARKVLRGSECLDPEDFSMSPDTPDPADVEALADWLLEPAETIPDEKEHATEVLRFIHRLGYRKPAPTDVAEPEAARLQSALQRIANLPIDDKRRPDASIRARRIAVSALGGDHEHCADEVTSPWCPVCSAEMDAQCPQCGTKVTTEKSLLAALDHDKPAPVAEGEVENACKGLHHVVAHANASTNARGCTACAGAASQAEDLIRRLSARVAELEAADIVRARDISKYVTERDEALERGGAS